MFVGADKAKSNKGRSKKKYNQIFSDRVECIGVLNTTNDKQHQKHQAVTKYIGTAAYMGTAGSG